MRGNATIIALMVIATMTTASLQLWRLWSMHVAIMHERAVYYNDWLALNTCFDATVCTLQASYNQCAREAKAQGVALIVLPDALQKEAVVCATMQYTGSELFLVTITRSHQANKKQTVRFLVEKQAHAQGRSQLMVHHVTFGVIV